MALEFHYEDDLINDREPQQMNRKRLFIDMDGTLAVFTPVDTLETLYQPGYFYNLKPIQSVVDAIKIFVKENPDVEVHVLSSVLSDSQYALEEKNQWLDKYLPEIPKERRLFPACGIEKKSIIPDGITSNDFLLDDYTKNLLDWQPPGSGIKLLNGINHTRGTWLGKLTSSSKGFIAIVKDIKEIIGDGNYVQKQNAQKILEEPRLQKKPKIL